MNTIVASYQDRGVVKGGLALFPDTVALEVIQALRKAGSRVYGLDAFNLKDGNTQPVQEHSIDLSSHSIPWDAAVEFLKNKEGKQLHFEIVTD